MSASSRPTQTAADYVVVGLSPLLIFLMINSLANFLMLILYRGGYPARVAWIVMFFTLGTVGIARIAIEKDRTYSLGYAIVLGAATLFVILQYVNLPIASITLLAVIAYLSDWVVRDCTLIDETADSSDQGLVDSGRLFVRKSVAANDSQAEATSDAKSSSTKQAPGTEPKQPAGTDKRGGQPGRSVFLLALFALPLYGLGQFFIRADERSWASAQKLLALYLFSALALLVTTSFLGLRRYLRQRGADMPQQVSIGWIAGGLLLIALILGTAYLVPIPGRLLASFELPAYLDSPGDLVASQFGWGDEGADKKGENAAQTSNDPQEEQKEFDGTRSQSGAKPGAASGGDNPNGQPGKQSGGKKRGKSQPPPPDSSDQQQGTQSADSSSQQKSTQQRQSQQQPSDQSSRKSRSDEQPSTQNQPSSADQPQTSDQADPSQSQQNKDGQQPQSRQESSDKPNAGSSDASNSPQQPSDPPDESGSSPDDPTQNESSDDPSDRSDQQSGDRSSERDQTDQSPESAQQESRSPQQESQPSSSEAESSQPLASLADSLKGLGSLFKVILLIGLLGVVAAYIWINRKWIAEFWRKLFESDASPEDASTFEEFVRREQSAPPKPFAAYRQPADHQSDPRKSIVIAFSALQAWCREADLPRQPDETPSEFMARLHRRFPRLRAPTAELISSYNHVTYGRGKPGGDALRAVEQVWDFMTSNRPASESSRRTDPTGPVSAAR